MVAKSVESAGCGRDLTCDLRLLGPRRHGFLYHRPAIRNEERVASYA